MTRPRDINRQKETLKGDREYPPTPGQKETLDRILGKVCPGKKEFSRVG